MNIIQISIFLTIISVLPPFVLHITQGAAPYPQSYTVKAQSFSSTPTLRANPLIITEPSQLVEKKQNVQLATQPEFELSQPEPPQPEHPQPEPPQPEPESSLEDQGSCFDYTEEYAQIHEVDMHLLNRIIKAESEGNPYAQNPYSSASGCAQFVNGTWRSTRKRMGKPIVSPFDARANVETLAWTVRHQGTHPWNASRHKWQQ